MPALNIIAIQETVLNSGSSSSPPSGMLPNRPAASQITKATKPEASTTNSQPMLCTVQSSAVARPSPGCLVSRKPPGHEAEGQGGGDAEDDLVERAALTVAGLVRRGPRGRGAAVRSGRGWTSAESSGLWTRVWRRRWPAPLRSWCGDWWNLLHHQSRHETRNSACPVERGGERWVTRSAAAGAVRAAATHDADERLDAVVLVVHQPGKADLGGRHTGDRHRHDVLALVDAGHRHRQDHDAGVAPRRSRPPPAGSAAAPGSGCRPRPRPPRRARRARRPGPGAGARRPARSRRSRRTPRRGAPCRPPRPAARRTTGSGAGRRGRRAAARSTGRAHRPAPARSRRDPGAAAGPAGDAASARPRHGPTCRGSRRSRTRLARSSPIQRRER